VARNRDSRSLISLSDWPHFPPNSATMSAAAAATATPPSTEELDKLRAGIAVQAEAVKSLKASGAAKVSSASDCALGI